MAGVASDPQNTQAFESSSAQDIQLSSGRAGAGGRAVTPCFPTPVKLGANPGWASKTQRCYILLVPISDTSPEAAEVQLRLLREMSGEQRLRLAFELSDLAQKMTKAGIRQDHPEWSEGEVNREWLRRCFFPKPLPPGL